jgi:hypothetical protein
MQPETESHHMAGRLVVRGKPLLLRYQVCGIWLAPYEQLFAPCQPHLRARERGAALRVAAAAAATRRSDAIFPAERTGPSTLMSSPSLSPVSAADRYEQTRSDPTRGCGGCCATSEERCYLPGRTGRPLAVLSCCGLPHRPLHFLNFHFLNLAERKGQDETQATSFTPGGPGGLNDSWLARAPPACSHG